MTNRRAKESLYQIELDETKFDDSTIGDASAFLNGIDDDDFIGNLLSANNGEFDMMHRTHEESSVDAIDQGILKYGALAGSIESQFYAGASTRVLADDSIPLVDPPAQNCETKRPARALYSPNSSQTNPLKSFTQGTQQSQLLAPICPKGTHGIGKEGAHPYQPVKTKKRGPYFERRESWTMTYTANGSKCERLSGTISTTRRNNPLPSFQERIITVSIPKGKTEE